MQISWEAIGAVGEIVGAMAVVVSLLYLATQIKTQNREARIASAHEILEAFRSLTATFEERDKAALFLKASTAFDSLDDVERLQFIAISQKVLRVWEEAFHQHHQARLDDHVWQAMRAQFSDFMGTPGGQRVWELRKHGFSDDFRSFVDANEPGEFRLK